MKRLPVINEVLFAPSGSHAICLDLTESAIQLQLLISGYLSHGRSFWKSHQWYYNSLWSPIGKLITDNELKSNQITYNQVVKQLSNFSGRLNGN